jgi:hypothetical protein
MLLTNQRLDKLAAARVDFVNRGMLDLNNPQYPGVIQISVPMARRESGDEDEEFEFEEAEPQPAGMVQTTKRVPMVTGNVTLARSRSMFFQEVQ